MTPVERARQIIEAWQRNPGIAGEPDLQERIANAIRETIEECAKVADDVADSWEFVQGTTKLIHTGELIRALKG